jgi:hypothetical protein
VPILGGRPEPVEGHAACRSTSFEGADYADAAKWLPARCDGLRRVATKRGPRRLNCVDQRGRA